MSGQKKWERDENLAPETWHIPLKKKVRFGELRYWKWLQPIFVKMLEILQNNTNTKMCTLGTYLCNSAENVYVLFKGKYLPNLCCSLELCNYVVILSFFGVMLIVIRWSKVKLWIHTNEYFLNEFSHFQPNQKLIHIFSSLDNRLQITTW
jgi:hypothetical protein